MPPLIRGQRYGLILLLVIAIGNLFFFWGTARSSSFMGFCNRQPLLEFEGGNLGMEKYVKSSFDWGHMKLHFGLPAMIQLPPKPTKALPQIQHPSLSTRRFALDARSLEVKKAFQKCWSSYRKYAWLRDELRPVSGEGKDTLGGWAATLIDSLGTLWIMNLEKEFQEAVEAVATINWAETEISSANMFETNIRYLGGLLSAYDLSHQKILLSKAIEIGDLLYAGFDTPNHLPGFWLNFAKARRGTQLADDNIALASPGTLSLEFTRLSQLSGNVKYYNAISCITRLLNQHQNITKLPGMWPVTVNLRNPNFSTQDRFSLGGNSDSAYEYLPKMYALLGGSDTVYDKMSRIALETIDRFLLFRPMLPKSNDILVAGEVIVSGDGSPHLSPDGQHLSCFAGGMFALSGRLFGVEDYVDIGAKLTNGCIWAYEAMPTGVMPEEFTLLPCAQIEGCEWDEDLWREKANSNLPEGFVSAQVSSYLLRPEAIESVFILYRITGRKEYQDAAWKMFKSIMKATETVYGNSAISDVTTTGKTSKTDSMESFWLAETLKYFYLIFSPPDLISLDEYVFNTEAHPLRRTGPEMVDGI